MTKTQFHSRLEELVSEHSSANAFSTKVGIGNSLIRKYLAGAMPGIDKAAQIAAATGVRLEWLITGKGPKGLNPDESQLNTELSTQLAWVPRLDVQASAGKGSFVISEDIIETIGFQKNWLHRRGINQKYARALTVRGDSMEPTLRDDDLLVVDTSINEIRDNALYVVVLGGLVLVKRVQLKRNGSLTLISDNDKFAPEEVPATEADTLQIAGRVMWFGRCI